MATWRLATLAGGMGQKLRGAALPVPAVDAGAWKSRGPVVGIPGTMRIPAPAPVPQADSNLVAKAQTGWIGLPSSQFSYWLPGIWYTPKPGSRAPVSVFSDNQMPVPAVDPRGVP